MPAEGRGLGSRTAHDGRGDVGTVSRAFKRERRVFGGRRHDLVREPDAGDLHVRIDERRLETGLGRGVRHQHRESRRQQLPPSAYRYRASRRLYTIPLRSRGGRGSAFRPTVRFSLWKSDYAAGRLIRPTHSTACINGLHHRREARVFGARHTGSTPQ